MRTTKQLLISMIALLCCSTGAWAEGELNGLFTINASGDKVQFSQGNLQWSGTNGWRFASNQWDIIGSNANNTSPTSSNESYMDLFCWGATGLNGVAPNTEYSYLSGSSVLSGNNDWGTNMGASWRTLTSDEWAYLFNTRASGSTVNGTSNARYAFATIRTDVNSGINGIILFPDGINFAASEFTTLGTVNGVSSYATKCTSDQWTALEGKGCVFLPAAGFRSGSTVSYAGVHGSYWSSSPYASYEADKAYDVYFGNVLSLPRETQRFLGSSVRLAKDYQLQQDAEGNYLLSSADDWKDFAAIVNTGTNPAANAKMTADIDLGGDQTMIGTLSVPYQGSFDGQGHMLTVAYDISSDQTAIAPFACVNGATIQNLHVAGSIRQRRCAAGGVAGSVNGNLTVRKCWVSATLKVDGYGDYQGTIGGIASYCDAAGVHNSSILIEDCLFSGHIATGYHCGGIMSHVHGSDGYNNSAQFNNCLNIGTINGIAGTTGTFIRTGVQGDPYTITNCHYQTPWGGNQGTYASSTDLSNGTTATALNAGRTGDEAVWVQDPMTNLPMLKLFATYKVPSSGIGTFSAKANFTLPEGLDAYYCKDYADGKISVRAIKGAVPANTGVLLKGEPGETYTLTGTNSEAASVTDNALVAVTEQTVIYQIVEINEVEYTNFGLSGGVFKKVNSNPKGVTVKANRAYLQIPSSALPPATAAEGIMLVWDEETDGIEIVQTSTVKSRHDDAWFTLDGRQLSGKPTAKGLYIVNGKKVIVK